MVAYNVMYLHVYQKLYFYRATSHKLSNALYKPAISNTFCGLLLIANPYKRFRCYVRPPPTDRALMQSNDSIFTDAIRLYISVHIIVHTLHTLYNICEAHK